MEKKTLTVTHSGGKVTLTCGKWTKEIENCDVVFDGYQMEIPKEDFKSSVSSVYSGDMNANIVTIAGGFVAAGGEGFIHAKGGGSGNNSMRGKTETRKFLIDWFPEAGVMGNTFECIEMNNKEIESGGWELRGTYQTNDEGCGVSVSGYFTRTIN